MIFTLTVLPVGLYFSLFESSVSQATSGKRKMRIKVVAGKEQGRPSLVRSVVRSGLKLVPWQLAHLCLTRIPGWPFEPPPPPIGVIVGLVVVWVLIIVYVLSILTSRGRKAIYNGLVDVEVTVDEQIVR
jgi:hypothetical protein